MLKRSNLYIGMSVLAMMVGPTAVGRAAAAQESHGPAAADARQRLSARGRRRPRGPPGVSTALRPRTPIP